MAKTKTESKAIDNIDFPGGMEFIGPPAGLGIMLIPDPSVQISAMALLTGAQVVSALWKQKAEERRLELQSKVDDKKLLKQMHKDPEIRDLIFEILGKILQESAKTKRDLYYNYLTNITKGKIVKSPGTRSKILYVMSVIDFWEIDLLKAIYYNYSEGIEMVLRSQKEQTLKKIQSRTKKVIVTVKEVMENRNKGLNSYQLLKIKAIKETYDEESLTDGLQTLTNYGLIRENQERFVGTSYGPITSIGREFLKQIS